MAVDRGEDNAAALQEEAKQAAAPVVRRLLTARQELDKASTPRARQQWGRAVTDVLEAGLCRRVGLRLGHPDAGLYKAMRAAGGELPDRISVCECCALVFKSARKARAYRCPACHRRPIPQPKSDGSHGTTVTPIIDWPAGKISGWSQDHYAECRDCGRPIRFKRRDHADRCASCRKHGPRSRPRASVPLVVPFYHAGTEAWLEGWFSLPPRVRRMLLGARDRGGREDPDVNHEFVWLVGELVYRRARGAREPDLAVLVARLLAG